MALITETNQQYYQGAQGFRGAFLADGITLQSSFVTTFDTSLVSYVSHIFLIKWVNNLIK